MIHSSSSIVVMIFGLAPPLVPPRRYNAQLKSTFNVFEANKDTWGFYVSPEIGFNVYPWAYGPGLHFAAYYSYGTNKGDLFTYSVDGLSNFGLRVGIAF